MSTGTRQLRALYRELSALIYRDLGLPTGVGSPGVVIENTQQDKFDTYGGAVLAQNASSALHWLQLYSMEASADWVGSGAGTVSTEATLVREGVGAVKLAPSGTGQFGAVYTPGAAIDFTADGRFATSDYLTFSLYISSAANTQAVDVLFVTSVGNHFGISTTTPDFAVATGWNNIAVKRSDFETSGAPNWNNITSVQIFYDQTAASGDYAIFDNFQIVKADPLDGTVYNATGNAWDFFADSGTAYAWTILTDVPGIPFALAQLATVASRRYTAALIKPPGGYNIREEVAGGVLLRAAGQAGLWWGEDYNNCYELRIDTATNELKLLEYAGGAIGTTHATVSSMTFDPNIKYYLGLLRETDGTLKAYATTIAPDMFTAAALKITTTDDSYMDGSIGFVSYGINSRFFDLRAGSPKHARTAELAILARNAQGLQQIDGTARLTVEEVEEGRIRLLLDGVGFRQIGAIPSIELSENDTTDQNYEIVLNDGKLRIRRNNDVFGGAVDALTLDVSGNVSLPSAVGLLVANRQAMPALRGLWNMHDSAATTVIDLSGAGRHLTIVGNPTFGVYQATGLPEIPYIDFDGTGDYLSHADAAWNSPLGAVTMILWWKPDDSTPAAATTLGGHWVAAGDLRSFRLINQTDATVLAQVSSTGAAASVIQVISVGLLTNAAWNHVVLRYIPSTELSVFVNGVETLNTTSIPAALFNSTGLFAFGAQGDGATPVAGHMALPSLHAAALSDEALAADFAQSRALFSV